VAAILALHDRPVDDVPGVPPEMMAILRQCLAADPARRLPSAAALRDSLAAILEQPVHDARPVLGLQPALDAPSMARYSVLRSTASQRLAAPSSRPMPQAAAPGPGGDLISAPAGPAAETDWAAGHEGRATPARPRARPLALATLAGGGLGLVIIAALIVVTRLFAPGDAGLTGNGAAGTGAAGASGSSGITTTIVHCPAAFVPGDGARCPTSLECWGEVDETAGVITLSPVPCDGPYTWKAFAIGTTSSDAPTKM
jgi:hypothetical protein